MIVNGTNWSVMMFKKLHVMSVTAKAKFFCRTFRLRKARLRVLKWDQDSRQAEPKQMSIRLRKICVAHFHPRESSQSSLKEKKRSKFPCNRRIETDRMRVYLLRSVEARKLKKRDLILERVKLGKLLHLEVAGFRVERIAWYFLIRNPKRLIIIN